MDDRENFFPTKFDNQISMVDLHGFSPAQSETTVNRNLAYAQESHITEFRFVTGRGNHENARGERGTLQREFPNWISEENQKQIASIKKKDGYYTVSMKPFFKKNLMLNLLEHYGIQEIDNIKMLAEKGNDEAQQVLGYCFQMGMGVPCNEKEAFKWYKKSSDQNNPIAHYALGGCYWQGRGVKQNDQRAIALFEASAAQGFVWAMDQLGDIYSYGFGVEKDAIKAFDFYQRASKMGFDRAKRKLGHIYLSGRTGIPKDERKAFNLYKEVADNGDAHSAYNTACCYLNGQGIEKDTGQAFQYAKKAADLNDPDAQYLLYFFYHHLHYQGLENEKNPQLGLAHLKRAAESQHKEALFQLFLLENPFNQDYLIKAAKAGHIVAQAMVLEVFPHQIILTAAERKELSERFWRQPDEQVLSMVNNRFRILVLDAYLKSDDLSKKHHKKIMRLLYGLAEQNCPDALGRLGSIFMSGEFVKQDVKKAKSYWLKGAELGSANCFYSLGYYYEKRKKEKLDKPDYQKAFDYYSKGAKLNNAKSHNQLGCFYKNGMGVEVDIEKAIYHLEEAMRLDSPENRLAQSDGLFYNPIFLHAAYNMGALFWKLTIFCKDNEPERKQMFTRAVYWFLKARDAGSEDAVMTLKSLGIENLEISGQEENQRQEQTTNIKQKTYQASDKVNFWKAPEPVDLKEKLKIFSQKIGFEADWKISKEDQAWCYIPGDKLSLLEKYDIKPAVLKKTKDGRRILMIEQVSKQDLEKLLLSLELDSSQSLNPMRGVNN